VGDVVVDRSRVDCSDGGNANGLSRLGADTESPARDVRRSGSRVGGSAVRVVPLDPGLEFNPSRSSTSNTMNEAAAT
jgi:hypothetical protein